MNENDLEVLSLPAPACSSGKDLGWDDGEMVGFSISPILRRRPERLLEITQLRHLQSERRLPKPENFTLWRPTTSSTPVYEGRLLDQLVEWKTYIKCTLVLR